MVDAELITKGHEKRGVEILDNELEVRAQIIDGGGFGADGFAGAKEGRLREGLLRDNRDFCLGCQSVLVDEVAKFG